VTNGGSREPDATPIGQLNSLEVIFSLWQDHPEYSDGSNLARATLEIHYTAAG
jgi:hypothetical protein